MSQIPAVLVARGLKASCNNAQPIELGKVEAYAKQYNNCYELLKNEFNRVFFDIDYSADPLWSQDEFDVKDKEVFDIINNTFDKPTIATSSSYDFKKISWRVFLPDQYTSKKGNQIFAKNIQQKFPEGITIDTSVYGNNRKMRMIYSSKDGENRPLVLKQGSFIDTIISYIPTECKKIEVVSEKVKEKEAKKEELEQTKHQKVKEKQTIEEQKALIKQNNTLLNRIGYLTSKRLADYQSWIELGLILWNAKLTVEVWDEISQRASNYEVGACEKKWKTFKDAEKKAGLTTILEWIKEDTPEIYGKIYDQLKERFEENHFKVMNPPQFVRQHTSNDKTKTIQFISGGDLNTMYANLYSLNEEPFISRWIHDETIRCYEALGFYPNPSKCPKDKFNLFNGFAIENIEPSSNPVSIDRIITQMKCLVGNNNEYYEYLIRYIAHMFQFPDIKARIALIFNGGQGTGKDTFWDFIGSLMGKELYYSTGRAEDDVFGRFNINMSRRILVKLEETNRDVLKKNKERLKTNITQTEGVYEDKGVRSMTMNSVERYVLTTNEDTPTFLEDGERRMCLFTPSSDHCGDTEYFDALCADYDNPEIKRAFFDYLMKIDLTNWNILKRPITDTYKETKLSSAPPLARFFGDCVASNHDITYSWSPTRLCEILNEKSKFVFYRNTLGKYIKPFIDYGAVITPVNHHQGTNYQLVPEKVKEYLTIKGWWYEDPKAPETHSAPLAV
jgi:hypothetical protein